MSAPDPDLPMLRYTVATLAYRAGKAVRGAPESFGDFHTGQGGRTPVQILTHMGDLFDWALTMADGEAVWKDAAPRVRLSHAGIQSVNVEPGPPSLFATSRRPRWAWRTFWTTVRPRPVPGTASLPWNLR